MVKRLSIRENTTKVNKVNMNEFRKKYGEEYDFLYNAKGEVAGEREAIELFDDLCKNNESFLEFVREYVKSRGYGPISSDRECVAFIFALDDMGVEF